MSSVPEKCADCALGYASRSGRLFGATLAIAFFLLSYRSFVVIFTDPGPAASSTGATRSHRIPINAFLAAVAIIAYVVKSAQSSADDAACASMSIADVGKRKALSADEFVMGAIGYGALLSMPSVGADDASTAPGLPAGATGSTGAARNTRLPRVFSVVVTSLAFLCALVFLLASVKETDRELRVCDNVQSTATDMVHTAWLPSAVDICERDISSDHCRLANVRECLQQMHKYDANSFTLEQKASPPSGSAWWLLPARPTSGGGRGVELVDTVLIDALTQAYSAPFQIRLSGQPLVRVAVLDAPADAPPLQDLHPDVHFIKTTGLLNDETVWYTPQSKALVSQGFLASPVVLQRTRPRGGAAEQGGSAEEGANADVILLSGEIVTVVDASIANPSRLPGKEGGGNQRQPTTLDLGQWVVSNVDDGSGTFEAMEIVDADEEDKRARAAEAARPTSNEDAAVLSAHVAGLRVAADTFVTIVINDTSHHYAPRLACPLATATTSATPPDSTSSLSTSFCIDTSPMYQCRVYKSVPQATSLQPVGKRVCENGAHEAVVAQTYFHDARLESSHRTKGTKLSLLIGISVAALSICLSLFQVPAVQPSPLRVNWQGIAGVLMLFSYFGLYAPRAATAGMNGLQGVSMAALAAAPLLVLVSYVLGTKDKARALFDSALAVFGVSASLFMLLHLVQGLSMGDDHRQLYSPFLVASVVCILLYVLVPFSRADEAAAPAGGDGSNNDNDDFSFDAPPRVVPTAQGAPVALGTGASARRERAVRVLGQYARHFVDTGRGRVTILALYVLLAFGFGNFKVSLSRSARLFLCIPTSIALLMLTLPRMGHVAVPEDEDSNGSIGRASRNTSFFLIVLAVFAMMAHFFVSFTATSMIRADEDARQARLDAKHLSLVNAAVPFVISATSLIAAQMAFGGTAFYPSALLCSVSFFTLYQHSRAVQEAVGVCQAGIGFLTTTTSGDDAGPGAGAMLYMNSEQCGTGSHVAPSESCRLDEGARLQTVQMLDKSSACQLFFHHQTPLGAWQLRHSMSFTRNCKEVGLGQAPAGAPNECVQTLSPPVQASAISIVERCQLTLQPERDPVEEEEETTDRGGKGRGEGRAAEAGSPPPLRLIEIKGTSLGLTGVSINTDFASVPMDMTEDASANGGLDAADVELTTEELGTWDRFSALRVTGRGCIVRAFEKDGFKGTSEVFREGSSVTRKNMRWRAFKVMQNVPKVYFPEVLPFTLVGRSAVFVNVVWRLCFYASLLAVLVSAAKRSDLGGVTVLCVTYLVAGLMMAIGEDGFSNGLGLGMTGISGTEVIDPNVFFVKMAMVIMGSIAAMTSYASDGRVSRAYFGLCTLLVVLHAVVMGTSSILPLVIHAGLLSIGLGGVTSGWWRKVALATVFVTVMSIISVLMIEQELPAESVVGGELKDERGFQVYVRSVTDVCAQCSLAQKWALVLPHVFHQLGVDLGTIFETLRKKVRKATKDVARLGQDGVDALQQQRDAIKDNCADTDPQNPLCRSATRNQCEFSYCIDAPNPIRMRGFDASDVETEDGRTRTRCLAHRALYNRAVDAVALGTATAEQTYCQQYHRNDKCENVCSTFWEKEDGPDIGETLQKTQKRLDVIDDSILYMSPEEQLQQLQKQRVQ